MTEKPKKKVLNFIRIGTSGAIQPNIKLDSFLLSEIAVGLDGLLHFYNTLKMQNDSLITSLEKHLAWQKFAVSPYAFDANKQLFNTLSSKHTVSGITVTNTGFYGPQGRSIRLVPKLKDFYEKLVSFNYQTKQLTNLEMETAGIYGLAKLLGHRAISINAILANRATGEFSSKPSKTVTQLIQYCLEKIASD